MIEHDSGRAIMSAARRYVGLTEYPGRESNPAVEAMFTAAGHPGMTDDVPWCAAFVGAVLAECGAAPSGSLMARSYLKWGRKVDLWDARPGDVVVIKRGKAPAGHVFFFSTMDGERIIGLGGNQGDKVSEASFHLSSVLGVRRSIEGQDADRPTLQEGDRGPAVADLQGQLAALRYFSGRRDGIFGPLTRAAVAAFQGDYHLEVHGIVEPKTWDALRAASPRPERDITARELRQRGSETVKAADSLDLIGGATAVTTIAATASEAAHSADGALAILSRMVTEHWPALLLIAAALAVIVLAGRIRAARVRDARTGANVGR
ncbi:MAG: TIGR02594 family protein [Pseudomonadota bacterium]